MRMLPRLVGLVVRVDTCRRSVPRRRSMRWKNPPLRVRLARKTIMVGSVGSYFDVGSVSDVTLEARGADENICSMGAPDVREGESVYIEIDSGAEVSCLRTSAQTRIPARDEAQRVWRSPRCGWWRQTA